LDAPVNAPAGVADNFTFQQIGRYRRAIDGDKRFRRSLAMPVIARATQLLAGCQFRRG